MTIVYSFGTIEAHAQPHADRTEPPCERAVYQSGVGLLRVMEPDRPRIAPSQPVRPMFIKRDRDDEGLSGVPAYVGVPAQ
jgi:hypothetical protein